MLPINQSKSTQPSLTSSFSQSTSAFSNTVARPDSRDRIYEPAGSVTQVSTGLVSIPVSGSNHQVEVHYHGTPLDLRLLETLIQQQNLVLQPNTTPLATLGEGIKTMRKAYLSGLHDDETIRDALSLYVAPEGKAVNSGESGERFDLNSKLNTFLESDKKVFLLLGEAGSGKSTFNRYLARDLWEKYERANEKKDERIPVFIQLTTLEDPNKNLLTEFFTEEGFSKEQIQQLRQSRRFIFILDGYDEIKHRQRAFYTDNKLDKWDAKVIISSRPEYLGASYQSKFYPSGQARVFEECELAPFSESAIKDYVERHIRHAQDPKWSADQYQSALAHPDLQALIGNPFLLKIVLQVLPSLGSEEGSSNQRSYTRIALYEQFAKNWFDRSQNRLQGIQLTKEEQKTFNRLAEEDFIQHGIHFSQEFALALYEKQVLVATYLPSAPDQAQEWRNFLGNDDEKKRLLRFNAPLSRQGDQYQFIHKSLRDYFVARALWEELAAGDKIEAFSRFNRLNIVNDPAILQFLAEGVRQGSQLETRLLSVVEQSKGEEGTQFETGAANALTILVKAGVQLINKDFNEIRVRGADLSYGVFDHTRFQDADLREVNWSHAWLRGVDLAGADLADVQLGERPALKMSDEVYACCYSPNGVWLAVAEGWNIQLYKTETMQREHTYSGHKYGVNSVVFSADSQWLASGGSDNTVKLWSVSGARPLKHAYVKHEGLVISVAFSPDGQWIASSAEDKTVRLWSVSDVEALPHTYAEHEEVVTSVAFSWDSQWVAFGSLGKITLWSVLGARSLAYTYATKSSGYVMSIAFSPDKQWIASELIDKVALWNISDVREPVHIYEGHSGYVRSVAFSSNSQWVVSGSEDKTVKLWSVLGARPLLHTYVGHNKDVTSVVFSPDDQWIASGGKDRTIRLWGLLGTRVLAHKYSEHEEWTNSVALSPDSQWVASGNLYMMVKLWHTSGDRSLAYTYAGHKDSVTSVAFSPDGQCVVSGSEDKTVKLWGVVLGKRALVHTYVGHKESVTSVAFSPDGQCVVSGSYDKTVKLWSVSGGPAKCTYDTHEDWVESVVFSPDGQWVASGSRDGTVKLWPVSDNRFLERTYIGHKKSVTSVAFSPDSQWIASGSYDKTVKLWVVLGAQTLAYHTYIGHKGNVASVAFSPDGQWVASGSDDNTVRLWSIFTGTCQAMLPDFFGPIDAVACQTSSDGTAIMLATGGNDETVRVWRVLRDDLGKIDQIFLEWALDQKALVASGALIGAARNLSPQNKALLMQRGAGRTYVGEGATAFFEEDSDELSSELDEPSEVSSESDGDDFVESDTNRYSENLSQNTLNLANVSIQERLGLNAAVTARIRRMPFASLEEENKLDVFNRLIENEFLLSSAELNETLWPEGELVEEGAPDTESSAKKRVHSTSSISSGINRKKGKGDDSFL